MTGPTDQKPNVALLQQVLAHIEAHPEAWDQESYRCRTGMCFAGWAVQLSGGQWLNPDPDGFESDLVEKADGTITDAEEYAASVLGLYEEDAGALFLYSNTLDDLRTQVAILTQQVSS